MDIDKTEQISNSELTKSKPSTQSTEYFKKISIIFISIKQKSKQLRKYLFYFYLNKWEFKALSN